MFLFTYNKQSLFNDVSGQLSSKESLVRFTVVNVLVVALVASVNALIKRDSQNVDATEVEINQ